MVILSMQPKPFTETWRRGEITMIRPLA